MHFMVDADDHSTSEFYQLFGQNLPKVVIVTQGFFGEIVDEIFDKDQVYRIHTTSRQKRVIAKTSGRTYSIPLSYPLKFCVVKKNGKLGKEQGLSEIVRECTFPIEVRIAWNQEFTVRGSLTSGKRFPQMTLTDVFDEMYFLANSIIDGVLDLSVIPIPLYLSLLRLAEITGIRGKTKEGWNRYTTELEDLVARSVEFDMTFGNRDIAEYQERSFTAEAIYAFLEPRTYTSIYSVLQYQTKDVLTEELTSDGSGVLNQEKGQMKQRPAVGLGPGYLRGPFVDSPISNIPASTNSIANDSGYPFREKKNELVPDLPQRNPIVKVGSPPKVQPKPNAYINDIPRGSVTPTSQSIQDAAKKLPLPLPKKQPIMCQLQTSSAVTKSADKSANYISTNLRSDVGNLSIKELGGCMEALNLTKYIGVFRAQMIDGTILKELDTEILKSDFGFSAVEAIRLMKFAQEGHIPK